MGLLCLGGGAFGFYNTRSMPSLIAGGGVGLLYLLASRRMQTGQTYGCVTAWRRSLMPQPRDCDGRIDSAARLVCWPLRQGCVELSYAF